MRQFSITPVSKFQEALMKPLSLLTAVSIPILALLASGCSTMRLAEAMVGTHDPNQKIVGQLFANGGGGKAAPGPDGRTHIAVEARPEETIWRPAVILMDRPGDLEIEFSNNNPQAHVMAVVPSDGGQMMLDLPPLRTGRMQVRLSSPGMYMFGSAMGNQIGRGMMGMIIVEGEVPSEARLDRPAQPRP
jgi:PQQ system protein